MVIIKRISVVLYIPAFIVLTSISAFGQLTNQIPVKGGGGGDVPPPVMMCSPRRCLQCIKIERDYAVCKQNLAGADDTIAQLTADNQALREELDQKDAQIKVLQEKIAKLQDEKTQLAEESRNCSLELSDIKRQNRILSEPRLLQYNTRRLPRAIRRARFLAANCNRIKRVRKKAVLTSRKARRSYRELLQGVEQAGVMILSSR
ncbi:MAG: hypothetical protein D6719_06300 [Candidatus Dadabacteria bacterium]|nr:MAG: hypothetical protein D6719_06300 [Candidatus Dadabacteria bacterium]